MQFSILSLVSYSLMAKITFLIFWRVFTLFWISFVAVWIIIKLGFLQLVGHNEVICYCSRMTSHFHWIITKNFSSIHILDHQIAYNKNFFLYRWATCQLCLIKLPSPLSLCTVVLSFFLWEVVVSILVLSDDLVLTQYQLHDY